LDQVIHVSDQSVRTQTSCWACVSDLFRYHEHDDDLYYTAFSLGENPDTGNSFFEGIL